MSAAHGSRLWPVLSMLLLLVCGAVALEVYARTRDPQAIVVVVRPQVLTTLTADDESDDEVGELEQDSSEPVNPAHEKAREQGRRGDLPGAIAALRKEVEVLPSEPALRADLGYFLLVNGETGEAAKHLGRARELDSKNPYTYLNLGVALRRMSNLPEAEKALAAALALRPGFRAAQLALATVLRKQHRLDEAVALLTPLTATGGNAARAEALLALGKTELVAGHGKRADHAFEQAIEWVPAQAEVRIAAARAYLNFGKREEFAKALGIATVAAELAPDIAEAHATLGRAKEQSKDQDGAEQAYQTAIRLRPDYFYARRRLLRIALDRRDFTQARAHAERLLAQAPKQPEHHFLAGLVAARADETDDARAHYLAAIDAAHGDYPEAYFNLGLLEKSAGRTAEAIAAYQKALSAKPDYLAALNNLGLAYAAKKDFASAKQAYQKALAKDVRYLAAWINLGEVHMQEKNFPDAIAAFERAVAVRPGSQEAMLNLGVAYRRADRLDEAIATYRKLAAAQPRYVSAWYNLGIALLHANKTADAQRAFEHALSVDPDHVGSLRRMATLFVAQGQLPRARANYESILDQDPADQEARIALADVYRQQGDVQACARAVAAALAGGTKAGDDLRARCSSNRPADALKL